ncbi:MAG: signal recognition particle receptor subunit alpha [Peptostreptococcaceae bacterium]|nr:signal recognition particle receptor subunit alpha [Peptostreptococcaceae bacterium]
MIFEGLADKLQGALGKLKSKGKLTEKDVKDAMREVKLALLEADVNFKVVKDFVKKVQERAVGQDVMESLTPAQHVIKIVNEGIILADTKKVVNEDGTTSLITVEDSEKLFECDSILVAVSQVPRNTIVSNNKGLDVNNRGLIMTDNSGHTTRDGVFACGDVTHGAKTVIEAVVAAKIVATSIDEYLK